MSGKHEEHKKIYGIIIFEIFSSFVLWQVLPLVGIITVAMVGVTGFCVWNSLWGTTDVK
jgi:nitrate reductase NapE component